MAYISIRTFHPTTWLAGTLATNIAMVFAGLQRRYQVARRRRALAGLSMSELKDFGYPVDEAPADIAARDRIVRRRAHQ
ncbi:hypothetical protein EOA27_15630 [Mesorhizobium sp. M2A.F.Ca.ET.037.01.1.1]|uniref:hypothetical protein n=1 Tax=unclassified Mesorhizobium TaxID=325217 RepID=UPI000F756532|nr:MULTISPECIES: hypothetical protein [unclassified Mesorhizobium]RUY03877.1 hypothetical protein EOA25_19380 [Mesorhizobium sp. M2A.F.Ca.ET.040.01.1.1]RVC58390.1 hypothetical protein EN759_34270 [Mesorhizobium sp. M00.F.Ca.ET.038.03.1.1]RVC68074.1 hypothetical protein EN766_30885 [Mesorhizobium sp. M2A.F.Ca.ET.046.02.1.1]AZO37176.1 hypothetical protein EJ072_24195 [Mesorhizobium sp. M2A.F.Ca.ET.046.03.2.1]RUX16314.1 hypothetical protein EOA27_15630 [Mesorhizobium sp. M2A.F.Ca.ET.037.01.1.1]